MENTAAHHDDAISLDLRLQTPSLPAGDIDHRTSIANTRDEASFTCDYCDRRFFNRRALGGHQNAHRLGRAFGRNERRRDVAATPVVAPPFLAHWLHARREKLRRAYLASAGLNSAGPTWEHNDGEAAAAPELDLSLKL